LVEKLLRQFHQVRRDTGTKEPYVLDK